MEFVCGQTRKVRLCLQSDAGGCYCTEISGQPIIIRTSSSHDLHLHSHVHPLDPRTIESAAAVAKLDHLCLQFRR